MDKAQPDDLIPFQRNLILLLLLALTATAWAVLVWQQSDANMGMTMVSPIMGLRALLFLAIWVIMMVAMMLPTTAPMILTFHSVQAGNRSLDDAFASTWVFVGAYLLVWAFAGIAAFAGVLVAEIAAKRAALPPATAAQVGGAIFLVAGIYQLTPLKEICLSKCRTSIDFTSSWRDGTAGALRMGLLHGAYCLGCCWLLFVTLFPLGMSVEAMAGVTLVIFAEKTLPWPKLTPRITAVVLVLYGALLIASLQLLPTFQKKDGSAPMPTEMQMKMPGAGNAPALK
ncbi:MAG: DUF2182 domain-containing protein [Pseudolabrys sp.]